MPDVPWLFLRPIDVRRPVPIDVWKEKRDGEQIATVYWENSNPGGVLQSWTVADRR